MRITYSTCDDRSIILFVVLRTRLITIVLPCTLVISPVMLTTCCWHEPHSWISFSQHLDFSLTGFSLGLSGDIIMPHGMWFINWNEARPRQSTRSLSVRSSPHSVHHHAEWCMVLFFSVCLAGGGLLMLQLRHYITWPGKSWILFWRVLPVLTERVSYWASCCTTTYLDVDS